MTKLTIDSVCTKKQVYPIIIRFQNGYPTEDFETHCAVVLQSKNGKRRIATELDELVYAGNEENEDFGHTLILARDRLTGKVRLIETGSAVLKPENENTNQAGERSYKEPSKQITSLPQREPVEIVPHRPDYRQLLQDTTTLESDINNYIELETVAEPNRTKHSEQLLKLDNPNYTPQKNTIELDPKRINFSQKIETREIDLNILFSYDSDQNNLEPDKQNHQSQPLDQCELNLKKPVQPNRKKSSLLEANGVQRGQTNINYSHGLEKEKNCLQVDISALELNRSNQSQAINACTAKLNLFVSENSMQMPDIHKVVKENEIAEKEVEQISISAINSEVNDSKYNHMMNYYHDELFVPIVENNLKSKITKKNKKSKAFNDFSTVKEMFVQALGLNLKVHKEKRKHKFLHRNPIHNEKNNICATHGSEAIIDKPNIDENETQNVSDKFNKQDLESRTYTCGYCENIFEDKGSLIFHLISHDFIRNSKNAVLKPLVKKTVEVAKSNKQNTRNRKKSKSLDVPINTEVRPDNSTRLGTGFNTTRTHESPTIASNSVELSEQTTILQRLNKENELTEDYENCLMQLVKDKPSKCHTAEKPFVYNNCEEKLKEKDTLSFHSKTVKDTNKTKIDASEASDNVIEISKVRIDYSIVTRDDVTIPFETNKGMENAEERKHLQSPSNESKLGDNVENCPINLVKENSNESFASQIYLKENVICDHCENIFKDKYSLIFHLATHKINISVQVENDNTGETKYISCIRPEKDILVLESTENLLHPTEVRKHNYAATSEANQYSHEVHRVIQNPEQIENSHIDSEIKIINDSKTTEETDNLNVNEVIAKEYFICDYCGNRFHEKRLLICHLTAHTNSSVLEIAQGGTYNTKNSNINKKKRKTSKNSRISTKETEVNIMKTYRDVSTNHKTNKVIKNALINPEQRKNKRSCTVAHRTRSKIVEINQVYYPNNNRNYKKTNNSKSSKRTIEKIKHVHVHKTRILTPIKQNSEKRQNIPSFRMDVAIIKDSESCTVPILKGSDVDNENHRVAHELNILNCRKTRSSSRNNTKPEHKDIVNVRPDNKYKSFCKNIDEKGKNTRRTKAELISSNSRINESQSKNKIHGTTNEKQLRPLNKKKTEQEIRGANNFKYGYRNIDEKDKHTTLKTSKSKAVFRHQINSKKKDDNTFICNDCGRVLKSKDTIITHLKSHNANRSMKEKKNMRNLKYSCVKCKSKFATQSEWLNHEIKIHNIVKAYKSCNLCEYKTLYRSGLAEHRLAHSNVKPLKCNYCKKKFRLGSSLKRHIRRHTGEKPFICTVCKSAFPQKCDLDLHLLTHAEKSHSCKICKNKFTRSSDLKRHMLIHAKAKPSKCDSYSCKICNKNKFTRSSDLKRHMVIHAKDKPFKCDSCTSSFIDNSALKRHIKRHTGGKPYRCNHCDFSTAFNHNLKRHIKLIHS